MNTLMWIQAKTSSAFRQGVSPAGFSQTASEAVSRRAVAAAEAWLRCARFLRLHKGPLKYGRRVFGRVPRIHGLLRRFGRFACRKPLVKYGPAFRIAGIGLLALLYGAANLPAKEVDRLLVAVNGTVITEGDLFLAGTLNPLIFSAQSVIPVSRRDRIDSLIDLELIRQEMKNFSMDIVDENSVDDRVKALKDRLAETGGIVRPLEQLGLTESELNSYIKSRILILDFLQYRFSPFATVSEAEIGAYYKDTFVPQLRDSGLEPPPLSQVSGRIEEILKEEKINEALDQWLADARGNARIEYFDEEGGETGELEHTRQRSQSGAAE